MENAIAKPLLRVIRFSKLSISLKYDQVNKKKKKASVILTELKTECGEICIFPAENRVTIPSMKPNLSLRFRSLSTPLSPLSLFIPCFIPTLLCSLLNDFLLTLNFVLMDIDLIALIILNACFIELSRFR